jgi:hypothetical protein
MHTEHWWGKRKAGEHLLDVTQVGLDGRIPGNPSERFCMSFGGWGNHRIAKHTATWPHRLKSHRLIDPYATILEPWAACCRRWQEHCQPPSFLVADRYRTLRQIHQRLHSLVFSLSDPKFIIYYIQIQCVPHGEHILPSSQISMLFRMWDSTRNVINTQCGQNAVLGC